MAYFPDHFIEALRDRVDLIGLIGRHVPLKRSGVNWSGPCPFHDDKDPSFTVRPDRGFFKCFGCGVSGDAISFVMRLKGLPFPEAVEELARESGIPLPEAPRGRGSHGPKSDAQREAEEAARRRLTDLYDLLGRCNRYFQTTLAGAAGAEARDYLRGRGLSAEDIRRFGLGFAPPGWRNLLNHFGGGAAAGEGLEAVGLAAPSRKSDPTGQARPGARGGAGDGSGSGAGYGERDGSGSGAGYGERDGSGSGAGYGERDGSGSGAGYGERGGSGSGGGSSGRDWYDRFRNRITFPILDQRGRCVAFGGRLMAGDGPKYINSPETELYQKGRILYGLSEAQPAIARLGRALVVEGYMDRIGLAVHGVDHVVATLGTALTREHLELLWRRAGHVTFCFDGDAAGRKAAWRALELAVDGLTSERRADFLFLPDGMDPDDLVRRDGVKGIERRLERTVSLSDFLLETLGAGLPTDGPEGAAALIHRLRPYLEKVRDPLLRDLIAERAANDLGVAPWRILGGAAHVNPGAGDGRWERRRAGPVKPEGQDFEQLLVALALRWPELAVEFEEELSRQALEDARLDRLLREWLAVALQWEGPEAHPAIEALAEPDLIAQAREVLQATQEQLGALKEQAGPGRRELKGCLVNTLKRRINRDLERLRENKVWGDRELQQQMGFKRDLMRLEELARRLGAAG